MIRKNDLVNSLNGPVLTMVHVLFSILHWKLEIQELRHPCQDARKATLRLGQHAHPLAHQGY